MTESIIPAGHGLEEVSTLRNILQLLQIYSTSPSIVLHPLSHYSVSSLHLWIPLYLHTSPLSIYSPRPILSSSLHWKKSIRRLRRSNANLLHSYINQTLPSPPRVKKRKRAPLFPQSGGTAFSTVVATEVNYAWPSILHTLKWSAGTGHKTLSICYIHQSSL